MIEFENALDELLAKFGELPKADIIEVLEARTQALQDDLDESDDDDDDDDEDDGEGGPTVEPTAPPAE